MRGRAAASAMAAVCLAATVTACASSTPNNMDAGGPDNPAAGDACGHRQDGRISGVITSRALGREVAWDARAQPVGASTPKDRPLLVLLHGAKTDETQWTAIGLDVAWGQAVVGHAHPGSGPPVVLTPDVPPNTSPAEAVRFLADELLPLSRRCFATTGDPAHRAIGGISAGGRIALEVAAGRPDLFSAVGGHSPAVRTADAPRLADRLVTVKARVQLDAGTDDGFRPGTQALGSALAARGANVSTRIPPGRHDRAYWRRQLPTYLAMYLSAI